MSKFWQTYYTAALGALGGLLGWWTLGSFELSAWGVWLSYPIIGAGLGLFIGGCVAAADGAVVKRLPRRALRDGLLGALVGAAAGLVGLLVAELGFLLIGGGFLGRTLGWMLLGGALGLSDGLVRRSPLRARYGAIGGLLGGALGGLIYEGLTQAFLEQSGPTQVVLGGVGLTLLGACIGALIPLARQVLSRAEIRVLSGEQAGLVREVSDSASIGSYDGCDVYLPDRAIAWRNLTLRRTQKGFLAEVPAESKSGAQVGQTTLAPGQSLVLSGGERIRLGATEIEFVGR